MLAPDESTPAPLDERAHPFGGIFGSHQARLLGAEVADRCLGAVLDPNA